MEVGAFVCSICEDPSLTICVYCTKDACANHLCDRCHRCSDCCACELTLRENWAATPVPPALSNGHVAMVSGSEKSESEGSETEAARVDQISDTVEE
jgi:hypothetical protein